MREKGVNLYMKNKDLFDRPLYKIFNYVYYFSGANILFLISNILFLMVYEAAELNIYSYVLLFVTAIPLGPSISALLSVMGKLLQEKEIEVWKDYSSAYRQNFKQSLKIWMILLIVMVILLVDVKAVSSNPNYRFFAAFFLGIMIILLLIALYSFPILTKFDMKTIDVIRASIYFSIRKLPTTAVKIVIIIGTFYVLRYLKFVGFMFFTSVIAFLIMFYDRSTFAELESKLKKSAK